MRYTENRFCHNLDMKSFSGVGKYDIPVIKPEPFVRIEYVSFNYCKTAKNPEDKGVHFFIDDYQFDRLWYNLKRYVPLLSRFSAIMTPDFSLFTDWPVAIQIMNHYRKHFIGAYLQRQGIMVYPTIGWSDERSYDWCFDGEPVGATVCVSSVGTQKNKESKRLFLSGYEAMIDKLKPETVIFYGNIPNEVKGNIVQIKAFTDKFKEAKISDF